MSSFGENFERDENKDMEFDTNAFYPVLESVIIMGIFYTIYKIYSILFKYKIKYQDTKTYRNCQCQACKQRLNNIIKKKSNNRNLIYYIGWLCFLGLLSSIYYKKIIETQSKVKVFDPYEILEISSSATPQEIKKAYKKLAIKYHPDKNLNNLQAKAKFMLVAKAYEALTNEEAKRNFELYGNPDGRGSMRFSIALPSTFILNKKSHYKIMIMFLIIVCVLVPYHFFKWFKKSQNFDDNGLLNITRKFFMQNTDKESKMLNIPFLLGISYEFMWIEDPTIDKQETAINELFDKYKSEFPTGNHVNRILEIIKLKNKKAVAIAYAYSFGEREDPNYLQLSKINEYIILLAKLIDAFMDSHNAKNILFNFCENEGEDESKIVFPKVSREFMSSIISFQQCFYQGIPINKIRPNISYVQLPYITTDNIDLITNSDENIKFRVFLKKNNEEKKIFLKKIFNFTDEQIAEILEAASAIPQYEYKIKHYVEGFEDTDVIPDDLVTTKITITRKNVGKLSLGVGHSKYFPGLFNECIYITILNGERIINQDKILIDKKVTEYTFPLKIIYTGLNHLRFSLRGSCSYGLNENLDGSIDCVSKSEKRKKLIESIKKRKEKLPLSYFQEMLKESGFTINVEDSDSDDEEEEDEQKKEENKEEAKDEKKEEAKDEKKENNKKVKEEKVEKEN